MSFSLLLLLFAYLIGGIPSGLLISRLFSLEDPRKQGSKNIGATNVFRSGHKLAALLTLMCDTLKGGVSVSLALAISPSVAPLAGIVAVLGHVFPIWIKFKGGKGIATAFGALLALNFTIACLCLVTWGVFLALTHYVSLASLITAGLTPLYAFGLGDKGTAGLGIALTLLVFWTHRENVSRLRQGREPKIDTHKPPNSPQHPN